MKERVKLEIYRLLLDLSNSGIGRENLYKFFQPAMIELTIEFNRLNCTPEELTEAWKEFEKNLPYWN